MNYGLYAIKDAKTGYMPVNVDFNDASAMRNFEHAVQNPDSLLRSHPNDYALFRVGNWDNDTGEIVPEFPPVQIADAASLVTKEVR